MSIPTPQALALANEKVEYLYEERDAQHILRVFGVRYRYEDKLSALQAKERIVTLLAETLQEFAADTQALNSWDPRNTIGQA